MYVVGRNVVVVKSELSLEMEEITLKELVQSLYVSPNLIKYVKKATIILTAESFLTFGP